MSSYSEQLILGKITSVLILFDFASCSVSRSKQVHVGGGDLGSCSLKETATYFYRLMGFMQFMPFGTSYIKPLSNCFFLFDFEIRDNFALLCFRG